METKQLTFQQELQRLGENAPYFQPNTAVYQYIHWLNEQVEHKDPKFISDYEPIVRRTEKDAPEKRPFLTVITRTQGKRPEMLRETLLCLSGQSDTDFEVLLIGHKLNEEQEQLVQEILHEQPPFFREKIRYLPLDHGNRTTPLNFGFAHAYGDYVAILDDDDLVFDNWVEDFHRAALETPDKIIHNYVLAQHWVTVASGDTIALRATDAHDSKYCKDFHLVSQLTNNLCPLMSFAFPTTYFKRLGILFDEDLTTTEDWDFAMRLSFLTGVTDVRNPSAIYRLWENAENSATEHDGQEWADNYLRIQDKFLHMPILLPQDAEKVYIRENTVIVTEPIRTTFKNKLRRYIPKPIWWLVKKTYRLFGGNKWLG